MLSKFLCLALLKCVNNPNTFIVCFQTFYQITDITNDLVYYSPRLNEKNKKQFVHSFCSICRNSQCRRFIYLQNIHHQSEITQELLETILPRFCMYHDSRGFYQSHQVFTHKIQIPHAKTLSHTVVRSLCLQKEFCRFWIYLQPNNASIFYLKCDFTPQQRKIHEQSRSRVNKL